MIRWLALCLLLFSISCAQPESDDTGSEDGNAAGSDSVDDVVNDEVKKTEKDTVKDAVKDAVKEDPDKVLRHAVFFEFKEGSSEEDVAEVAEMLAALPEKIDAIKDSQWGVNNSPEKLDDGYTHCFLMTFENRAGLNKYLPHPDHKAFGKALGPHRGRVFVIDFYATPPKEVPEKQLLHAVFFKFKDDADPKDVKAVEEAFAALPGKIDSIKAFEWGTNVSDENKDEGFTHCFLVRFDSEEGRAKYLPHPDHKAFVDVLKPVLDKVRVLDFWATE